MKKRGTILEDVLVSDYAAEGKALAKMDGKVIFIEGGAVPGDRVDVRLRKNKKDWAEGRAVHFHSFAANRIQPFCEYFGVCGGCKWQMLSYEKQLLYKQQQVTETLQRIGKISLPDISPIIGSQHTTLYRNKLEFTFSNRAFIPREELGKTEDNIIPQKNALGFHIPGLFDKVLDIHHCYLQQEPSNAIRNFIREYAEKNNLSFYDLRAQTGWLRNIILRICTTGEVMVNICLKYEDVDQQKKLMDALLQNISGITTLLFTINPKQNDSIFDLQPQVYFGKGYVAEKLDNFIFKIGPKSFFQTNTYQAETLYRTVREMTQLQGTETVYDLYCGTGSIGIFVSPQAKKIVGIELIAEAIEDAKENALLNNINKTVFLAGDVIHICNEKLMAEYGRPDIIITDPPRAGMHEKLLKKLLEIAAPKIIYVSCNPATQARDAQLLSEKYVVTKMQAIDMFPHTHHIENVILLERKN